jgi:pimeloyl-ACP methyl ester carboxylesterase
VLEELRERLERRRLAPADTQGWERGVPSHWLAQLLADWRAFDIARFQARLDEMVHLRAHVDGRPVHLVHAPGRGPDPLPLVLTHGWPGSFCEYRRLLPLLTDPAAHGGDPADAFTVVVPSLPGFGFSAPPPPGGLTAEEGGYAHEQATKPATLGAALHDSPVALAAWIGEKVVAWSSTTGDGRPAFDRDLLLGTLTLYWATGTTTSSLQPYWAARHTPGSALPAGDPPPVPTAVSVFGGERVPFPKPPRELAERYFTLSGWREYARGGHFPAVAEPELLAEILRDTFRPLRGLR